MAAVDVLLDGYFVGKPYGFGRYVDESLHALAAREQDLTIGLAVPRSRVDEVPASVRERILLVPAPDAPLPAWEQVVLPRTARRLSAGVTHSMYNTGPVLAGRAGILTVHDLFFLQPRPAGLGLKPSVAHLYAKTAFARSARAARALIAVSGTTRDALAGLGLPSSVVPHSVDHFASTTIPEPTSWTEGSSYLLHRGGTAPHRNTRRVVQAFNGASRRTGTGHRLLVMGVPEQDQQQFADLDLTAVSFVPRLTDGQLVTLYRSARGVVAASLQEGFGLPIIEAFAFGAPVIAADRAPMNEIAGDAALLVDPESVPDIEEAVARLMTDDELVEELRALGTARRSAFSHQALSDGLLAVYRTVLDDQPARRPSAR